MFKKLVMLIMASILVFSFTVPTLAEAKSSYKAPRKSYTPTDQQKTPTNNVSRNEPSGSTAKTPGAATPATKPGFFSGGLMRGLLIGGMAGLLFGGLFGGMGALGNILGLLVNVLAIVVLIVVIMKIVSFFRQRRKLNQDQKRY
jgi:predicted lipid-binding transport protein (Tim44 family)